MRDEDVPIQVDVVEQARDVRAGGDAESGLDHAAEHRSEPERPRGMHHAHRLADAARLRELDVDPVRALRAGCDVGERMAVLVDIDRNGRAPLQLGTARVAGAQRLLAVLHVDLRQRLERLVQRPCFVDVALQRQRGDRAHRAHPLDVETVTAAELELQPLEPVADLLRPARHVVRIAEPDRPARRRALAPEAEQPPHGQPGEPALEIVERRVERRPCCVLLRREPGEDLVDRERIVAEQLGVLLHVRECRLRRLVVPVDRRRLAVPAHAAVHQLDLDDVLGVARAARNDERLRELEGDDPCRDLHEVGGYRRG